MRPTIRLPLAALLGVLAFALAACGSTGKGLIPVDNAGPLQSDFEAVAQAAQSGGGNCAATTEAIAKTEQDFLALPSTVDRGLRRTLSKGIANLSARARELCVQPLPTATTTNTSTSTTTSSTPTTQTTTSSSSTTTSSTQSLPTATATTPAPTEPPAPGGGTPAPGGEEGGEAGAGDGNGNGNGKGKGKGGGNGGNGGNGQ